MRKVYLPPHEYLIAECEDNQMQKNILFLAKSSSQFSSSYLQAKALKEYLGSQKINSVLFANSDIHGSEINKIKSNFYSTVAVHFESLDHKLFTQALHHVPTRIMIFHGITPAKYFWSTKPQTAFLSLLGQMQLRFNSRVFNSATADSPFTVAELSKLGFRNVLWMPCYISHKNYDFRPVHVNDTLELLFVGRIAENKGILELFSAVEQLAKVITAPIRLTIVGSIKPTSTYGKQVCNAIKRLYSSGITCENLSNLSLEELTAIYLRSHLYISHSFHEGFGIPAMDAIQYGVPAIYTACGGQESVLDKLGCAGTTTESLVAFATRFLTDEQARWQLWKEQKKRSTFVADVFRQTVYKLFITENMAI